MKDVPSLAERMTERDPRPIDSIIRHLRNMLNTRQGHTLIASDYGMPDLTGFAHAPDAVEALRRAISKSIKEYEPRLTSIQVSFVPPEENERATRLRFQVTASLKADSGRPTVRFETAVEGSGRILVKG